MSNVQESTYADALSLLATHFSWGAIHQYGFTRVLYDSIIRKFSLVMQNLHVKSNVICRHPIFDGYVSDEKRIVTYNLGMVFAKFYVEEIFNIPNLLHIEFLKKQDAVVLTKRAAHRRSRETDLVGSDTNGQWRLFEAKGISANESQLTEKLQTQKTS